VEVSLQPGVSRALFAEERKHEKEYSRCGQENEPNHCDGEDATPPDRFR
jgi:hypothetical protein